MNLFNYYNHLGFNSPYYIMENDELKIFEKFEHFINYSNFNLLVDPTSILSLINFNFFLGDRTIIKDLYKAPWMSKPSNNKKEWIYEEFKYNEVTKIDEKQIADYFFNMLVKEATEYLSDKKNIGILLSGGMDSRIAAGIIRYLIDRGILNTNVVCLTWGLQNTRDVVYAREMALTLNFEWEHFLLSPELLLKNLEITAQMGCGFSPIHLHAINSIKEKCNLDCIVAATYGDSIGRGVYSSRHVSKLRSFKNRIVNKYGLFKKQIFLEAKKYLIDDIELYRTRFPRKYSYQNLEVEQHANYLRNMLNPPFGFFADKIPVYQLFSKKEYLEYIWTIHPNCRNNNVYIYLLNKINPKLLQIPWANTGKRYEIKQDIPDKFNRDFHNYYNWIRDDLFELLRTKILSAELYSLNIFNIESLETLINNFYSKQIYFDPKVSQDIFWLASLSDLVKQLNITSQYTLTHNTIRDKLSMIHNNIIFETKNKLSQLKKSLV